MEQVFAVHGVPQVVHADRGTSMTSKTVAALLADLEVTRSHSRPRVSNDNPYSDYAGSVIMPSTNPCEQVSTGRRAAVGSIGRRFDVLRGRFISPAGVEKARQCLAISDTWSLMCCAISVAAADAMPAAPRGSPRL
jgi:hypothetical protein